MFYIPRVCSFFLRCGLCGVSTEWLGYQDLSNLAELKLQQLFSTDLGNLRFSACASYEVLLFSLCLRLLQPWRWSGMDENFCADFWGSLSVGTPRPVPCPSNPSHLCLELWSLFPLVSLWTSFQYLTPRRCFQGKFLGECWITSCFSFLSVTAASYWL